MELDLQAVVVGRLRVPLRGEAEILGDAEALLKVFFIADQRIQMSGNAFYDLLAVLGATDGCPEFGAVVEVGG